MVLSRRLSSGAEVGDSGEDADIDTPLFRSTPTQLWDRVDWNLTLLKNVADFRIKKIPKIEYASWVFF